MSIYKGVVEFNWGNLERQPLYVKGARKDNAKQKYRMELAVDRSSDDENFRGETFFVYGPNIDDVEENKDVVIKVDKEKSAFINQDFGSAPYIVLESLTEKPRFTAGV